MRIHVYSDESGVFDSAHNNYYVFGGIICLEDAGKELWSRKYSAAENVIRLSGIYAPTTELKACVLENMHKDKLFRSLNKCYKFGTIIQQQRLNPNIFDNKKSKQRFLDYAYKRAVKNALEDLIHEKVIAPNDVREILFYVDEHTTATNGRYELREGLEQEFKYGTFNYTYQKFFPPIFSSLRTVNLYYCNSRKKLLVRSADIVANKIYYLAVSNQRAKLRQIPNLHMLYLP